MTSSSLVRRRWFSARKKTIGKKKVTRTKKKKKNGRVENTWSNYTNKQQQIAYIMTSSINVSAMTSSSVMCRNNSVKSLAVEEGGETRRVCDKTKNSKKSQRDILCLSVHLRKQHWSFTAAQSQSFVEIQTLLSGGVYTQVWGWTAATFQISTKVQRFWQGILPTLLSLM